jgi:precorrin-2 dehydrogenase / sirohydrochlorin ferrochelatase
MGYYPIFLEVGDRPVLLVGGGRVAEEKLFRLLDAGADVTIVAPDLLPSLRDAVDDGRAHWLERPFEAGDTTGAYLVMIATDDGVVNRAVADEARASGILVNAADDVANCDFILPSLVRRGNLQIASSTGGSSPAMARWLRERLEEFLTEDVSALNEVLATVRREIRAGDRVCAARCGREGMTPLLCEPCPNRIPPDRWQEAIDEPLLALVRSGDTDAAQERLRRSLGRETLQPAPWWRQEEHAR